MNNSWGFGSLHLLSTQCSAQADVPLCMGLPPPGCSFCCSAPCWGGDCQVWLQMTNSSFRSCAQWKLCVSACRVWPKRKLQNADSDCDFPHSLSAGCLYCCCEGFSFSRLPAGFGFVSLCVVFLQTVTFPTVILPAASCNHQRKLQL